VLEIKEKEGLSYDEVSERFCIGRATVVRWHRRVEPKTTRNRPPSKINMELLRLDIETYPDAYQYERAERLGVSRAGIWHALRRLGVTYKKNPQASPGGPRQTCCLLPQDC
jgi:transposase